MCNNYSIQLNSLFTYLCTQQPQTNYKVSSSRDKMRQIKLNDEDNNNNNNNNNNITMTGFSNSSSNYVSKNFSSWNTDMIQILWNTKLNFLKVSYFYLIYFDPLYTSSYFSYAIEINDSY
jgi:hypothetical protein